MKEGIAQKQFPGKARLIKYNFREKVTCPKKDYMSLKSCPKMECKLRGSHN